MAIQSGEKPALIKAKLLGFVSPDQRAAIVGKAA